MKDYFTGSNKIPWWLSGVSYYMSCFSVYAFIAYAALAWEYGFLGVTAFWILAPAILVGVIFFAKKWRRARIDSPTEYLETRYSPLVRQLFAWQNIPVHIIDDAFKLVCIGVFISEGLGVNLKYAMLCSGLIILVYTFAGTFPRPPRFAVRTIPIHTTTSHAPRKIFPIIRHAPTPHFGNI